MEQIQFGFNQTAVVGILTFLLGTLFGHRFALWRDRRNEYNATAVRIRAQLLLEINFADPIKPGISDIDIDELYFRLFWWRRKGFISTTDRYKKERSRQQTRKGVAGWHYVSSDEIASIAKELLEYTRPR